MFLDLDDRTGELIKVLSSGQAVRVRSIRPVPEIDRWKAEVLLAIRATPILHNDNNSDQRDVLLAGDVQCSDDVVHGMATISQGHPVRGSERRDL